MPKRHDEKFREEAIEAVRRGERKSLVCRSLKISRNTLDLWLKQQSYPHYAFSAMRYRVGDDFVTKENVEKLAQRLGTSCNALLLSAIQRTLEEHRDLLDA